MKVIIKKLFKNTIVFNYIRSIYWFLRNKNPLLIIRKNKIVSNYNKDSIYLNIGGFIFLKDNWRVLEYISDQYPISKKLIDYNFNLLEFKPLPFKNNSVDLIYSSHTFEHILKKNVDFYFKEIYRILKVEGTFRMTVPDADIIYDACKRNDIDFINYLDDNNNQSESDFFKSYLIGPYSKTKEFKDLKKINFEKLLTKHELKKLPQNHSFMDHKCWFNYNRAMKMLIKSGFKKKKIFKSGYLQSKSSEMRNSKFFDQTIPSASLYVECVK